MEVKIEVVNRINNTVYFGVMVTMKVNGCRSSSMSRSRARSNFVKSENQSEGNRTRTRSITRSTINSKLR